jgi:Sulfotransferase family
MMEAAYRRSEPNSHDRAALGFGLFKAYENLGDYARAFSHLAEANRAHRNSYRYDPDLEGEIFGELKSFFSPARISRLAGQGYRSRTPIFIVGMPRSGTTLTEQILATHSMVGGGGELELMTNLVRSELMTPRDHKLILDEKHFTADRLLRMGWTYLQAALPLAEGKPHVTDKMPLNFRWIGVIKAILPDAKIIHCRRAPLDTCFSIYASYFGSDGNRFAYDLDEIGAYYSHYSSLMAHWRAVFPDDIHDFVHENLVADQERETRRLLDFLDLPFEPACLEFEKTERRTATVSNAQVKRGLNAASKGRTDRYFDQLAPLRRKLAEAGNAI